MQQIINVIFTEGQLDECDLTLQDLNAIAQSFLHTLEGIYHSRPAYPPGALGGDLPAGDGRGAETRTGAVQRRSSGTVGRRGSGGEDPG